MGWIARMLLLRVLPRKLLPILTVWEVWKIVRGRQEARDRARRGVAARDPVAGPAVGPAPGPATRRPTPR